MLASPKAVRLGAMGTRRNAGALPRGERYLRLVEAIPVSSNARAHACNQIDSQGVLQAYFMKRDVFALAHPASPPGEEEQFTRRRGARKESPKPRDTRQECPRMIERREGMTLPAI